MYHYRTAELEQARRTSDVVVVSRPVPMGTRASLPSEVSVVVDGVKSPVVVIFRAVFCALDLRFCISEGLNEVYLILDAHKPPVVQDRCGTGLSD